MSVPGAGHLSAGRDGDDAFATVRLRTVSGSAVVLALADGLGSRQLSGAAARLAVHAALAEAARAEPLPDRVAGLELCLRDGLGAAQEAVDRLAPLVPADEPPGCTLLLAVATGTLLVCLAVGDGAVLHLTGDGALLMPVGPDPDAHQASNVADALLAGEACPDPDVLAILDPDMKALALTSDGLADISVVTSPAGPVVAGGSALDALVRHVADGGDAHSLRDYLALDEALREQTADDLSLVVAAR